MKLSLGLVAAVSLALNAFLAYERWFAQSHDQTSSSTGHAVVMRTPGGLLEVSRVTAEERFDTSTSHTVLGVPVGRTVAQIRVPTVYRYHVPLAKEWNIRLLGNTLIVIAPRVQPSLPVAIDTGKLESFSSGLWSPITGADAVSSLQKSITSKLAEKASSAPLVLLQREAGRLTVSEFVQKWVVNQPQWTGAKRPIVLVFFEDEPLGARATSLVSGAD